VDLPSPPPPLALPPEPEPPDPSDCCGSGCVRCVYDLYDDALAQWRRLVAERSAPPES